jgi:hypothetical protein
MTTKSERKPRKKLFRPKWNDDDEGNWNPDTGAIGIMLFANSVQVWSAAQMRETSVAEAAGVFNCDPRIIIEAVEAHPWLFFAGRSSAEPSFATDDDYSKLFIEHEGE